MKPIDSSFLDTNLNTVATPYTYSLSFFVNGESKPIGNSEAATSIFLTHIATDELVKLSWVSKVPWNNERYVIYRKNDLTRAI